MGKTISSTLAGAFYGAVAAICLYIIGFVLEIFNLGCAILTCDCDKPTMFDWSGMWNLLLIFVIAGAIIGFFYGIYKAKEESDAKAAAIAAANLEKAHKQRINWANEIKQDALNLNDTCSKNKNYNKTLVSAKYKAGSQMAEIMGELTKITEKQGKVDSLAEELSNKGGASI